VIYPFVRICLCLACGLLACGNTMDRLIAAEPTDDRSVVIAPKAPSADVENGTAFERGEIDLGTVARLTVPLEADVVQEGSGTKVRLFTAKRLGFSGHPPEKMSIRTARNNFGCATRTEDGALVVGTFGEFATKEGGAHMKLRIIVPQGIAVEKRAELSGPSSKVHTGSGLKPRDPKGSYWYGPTSPADGWTIVKTTPDADRTAEKH